MNHACAVKINKFISINLTTKYLILIKTMCDDSSSLVHFTFDLCERERCDDLYSDKNNIDAASKVAEVCVKYV